MTAATIALVQRAYQAVATGDMAWMQEHSSPDVIFEQGGRFPTAGIYRGREAMFGHIAEFMALVAGNFAIEPLDFLASENRVAAIIRVTIGYQGRQLTFDEVHLWNVTEGQVTEMHAIPFDPYAVDEFFAMAGAPAEV